MLSLLAVWLLTQSGPNMVGPPVAALGRLLPNGETCSLGPQCVSGFCSDSKCCNTACGAACDSCSVVAGASVDGTCATVAAGGAGSPSCSIYVCDGSSTSCPTTCDADADCVSGSACSNGTCGTYTFSYAGVAPATECPTSNAASREGISLAVTRASAAYCTKADGTLVSIASNVARVNNDGILVERSTVNVVPRSQDLDNADWTATSVTVTANSGTAPDLTSTAEQLNPTAGAASLMSSKTFSGQHGSAGVVSLYAKTHDGTGTQDLKFEFYDTIATTGRGNSTVSVTGTWQRFSFNYASAVNGNASRVDIYPDISATDTEDIDVWGVQVEQATSGVNVLSSYFPTTTGTATRQSDNITVTIADIGAAGCVRGTAKFQTPIVSSPNVFGNTGAPIPLSILGNTQGRIDDGTTTDLTSAVASVAGRTVDTWAKWGSGTMQVSVDGSATSGSTAFDGTMGPSGAAFTTLHLLSSTSGGSTKTWGYLKYIRVAATKNGCD